MNRNNHLPLLVLILIFFLSCFKTDEKITNAKSLTDYTNTIDQVEKKIHRIIRKHHLPGFAITSISDQDIVLQKAFGFANIENNIEVTMETNFKIRSDYGSESK